MYFWVLLKIYFMKPLFFILLFTISSFSFAQNNHIVKTEDGRRVLLKGDFTWEYIDAEKPKPSAELKKPLTLNNGCNISANFEEPKLNNRIQAQLKRGHATIKHIKKRVAKDYNCSVNDVLLLDASETKQNGVYHFCIDGTEVKYKRVGNAIVKPLF